MPAPPQTSKTAVDPTKATLHLIMALVMLTVLVLFLGVFAGGKDYFRERQRISLQLGVALDLDDMVQAQARFRAKNGGFTTDLVALGLTPKNLIYKIGFLEPSSDPVEWGTQPARMNHDEVLRLAPEIEMKLSPISKLAEIEFAKLRSYCGDCRVLGEAFRALAVANLDDDATLDVWTVDQTGARRHLINDLSE
jgi:hypothetical protein